MYGCESWTVKKAEHWRIDAFELWCWRRLLRVPWTARRSNQYILKEISPGCSLERMMLKPKLQFFGHLMRRVDSLEKTLMLRGIGGRRRRGRQRMRWLDSIRRWDGWVASPTQWTRVWVNSGSWWWTGRLGMLRFMGSQRVGHDWATELNINSKIRSIWTSLVVRWVRFCDLNAEGPVPSPGQGIGSHMPQLKILHDATNKSLIPHTEMEIEDPESSTKTQCNQINIF